MLGRGFVGEPQDPASIGGDLQGGAFSQTAEAIEFMMRQQFHVERKRAVGPKAAGAESAVHGAPYFLARLSMARASSAEAISPPRSSMMPRPFLTQIGRASCMDRGCQIGG